MCMQILHSVDYAFIEMEKMNGGTLQGLIDRTGGPIDEETTRSIMNDVLAGLCLIHEKSYIHRDLKPDNILLNVVSNTDDYSIGDTKKRYIAKIADFGLSAEIRYGIFSGLNQIDDRMGTLLYMAPEQA